MTKDEALNMAIGFASVISETYSTGGEAEKIINACKEALEQPTVAELNNEYLRDTNVIGLEQPAQDTETMAVAIALQEHIRQLKEQPAQKPVAWMYENHNIKKYQEHRDASLVLQYGYQETPVYTHPHQWQGLTDDEIYKCQHPEYPDTMYFARAIEQALKEKNT